MTEQEFAQAWTTLETWVNSMRPHWRRLKGNVHDDKEFWRECLHQVNADVWHSWCELYTLLEETYPQHWSRHTHVLEDTQEIARRLDLGKSITIFRNTTGHNKAPFRLAMAIKDIVAKITDQPFSIEPIVAQRTRPTKQELLAEFDRLRVRVEALYD